MAIKFADRIKEYTTTTGTGDITLSGAVLGYRDFSNALTVSDQCYYCIDNTTEWEIGLGTYKGATFERTAVQRSSNSDTAVNFSSGQKQIFIVCSATFFNQLLTDISSLTLPSNLVFEYTVTGSAASSITTDGTVTLDINTHNGYYLYFNGIPASATSNQWCIYINNDTTATNYITDGIYSSGSSAGSHNNLNFPEFNYSNSTTDVGACSVTIDLISTHAFIHSYVFRESDNPIFDSYWIYKSTTDTNITRIDIVPLNGTANFFAVGTTLQIFKRKW